MQVNQHKASSRSNAGFTLIEMMVAMVMVAVLASIAIPSYRSYIRRAQLSDAFSTLADLRVKMEQYYQDNKFYGADAASTGCPALPNTSAFPFSTKNFKFECSANGGAAPLQVYLLTATGISGATTGYAYSLNQQGIKGTVTFDGASSGQSCWLTRAGECDN